MDLHRDRTHRLKTGLMAIVLWEDYRRLKAILCGEQRTRNDRVLGYAVYTEPQVGRVGMTLEQAEKQALPSLARLLTGEDMPTCPNI